MLEVKYVLVIFLLCLLQRMNCDEAENDIVSTLNYLSGRIGFCSKYFKYSLTDVFLIGKLTLPNIKIGDTIRMEFFQNTLEQKMHFKGSILPDESTQEVINRVRTKQPISFRIDFPIGNNVPELRNIFINGNELCSTILINTGTKIVLTHTLEIANNSLAVFKYNTNIPLFTESAACGQNDTELTNTELSGGTVVRRGEYPWLTAIHKKRKSSEIFICSGLLVTPQIVLTAANCFQGLTAEEIIVHLGHSNSTSAEKNVMVLREVEALIVNPAYKPGLKFSDADIALLIMKEPVSFTQSIKSICLWSEPVDESLTAEHTDIVSSDEDTDLTINDSGIECQRSSPVYAVLTPSRTLCTGKADLPKHCELDSSSDLMTNRNGQWMLRGITFQQRCDWEEHTVYCDIPKHMPWLGNYVEQQAQPISGAVEDICGKSGKISRNEHPWLAAIYKKASVGVLFFCTGALISSRTVLAPAHCFDLSGETGHADLFRIYLGRHDLNSIKENGIVTREIKSLIIHSNFEQATKQPPVLYYDYDIALLQMDTPVGFTQYITPICLWSEPADQSQDKGQSATLSSWDKIRLLDGSLTIAQSMEVNIVSMQQCQKTGYNVNITSAFLCTPRFGNNLDGILALKRNGCSLLRGIASSNFFIWKKYNSTRFRLYTDITEYLPWIQNNMLS